MRLEEIDTEVLKNELLKRGFKIVKPRTSNYGTAMKDTCHKGLECGLSGLGCKSDSCPHT